MFRTCLSTTARLVAATPSRAASVAVVGGAGGIGQPLSLLLRQNEHVSDLRVYDIVGAPGVAADLSHVPSKGTVNGFAKDDLKAALDGAQVVVVPAGMPRKPGMTRDDLFTANANIVKGIAEAVADVCPNACLALISNPINSMVPLAAKALAKAGVHDPRKVFGITTLDVIRTQQFVGEVCNIDPRSVEPLVVGGHAGTTILPVLSQLKGVKISDDELPALINRIQFGGDEVVKAKDGAGSATLSMAVAAARFTDSLLKALAGQTGISECAFVECSVAETPFFASRVHLGVQGVESVDKLPVLSSVEQANYDEMIDTLAKQIKQGTDFVN